MAKIKQMLIVFMVVAIMFGGAILLSWFENLKNNFNFVEIDVNPKVNFLSNKKDVVVGVNAINNEAKMLVNNENFVGKNIYDAINQFLNICAKTNFIDVNSNFNVAKITTISNFMQNFNVKVNRNVRKFLVDNEINCLIVDGKDCLENFKEAKKQKCDVEKLILKNGINEKLNLKLTSKKDLILKQYKKSEKYNENKLNSTQKNELINLNNSKINAHNLKLKNENKQEFKNNYKKFEEENLLKFQKNYTKNKQNWLLKRENSLLN